MNRYDGGLKIQGRFLKPETAYECVFMRHGFTLLEVMVALAIMAAVVLTVLGAVNYHLGVIAKERNSTTLTILARAKLIELEQDSIKAKSEGSFAPAHPEIKWQTELLPTKLPILQKLVMRVHRDGDKQEVTLERYLAPK